MIWDSHNGVTEDAGLLQCDTMLLGEWFMQFLRTTQPSPWRPSSPSRKPLHNDTVSYPRWLKVSTFQFQACESAFRSMQFMKKFFLDSLTLAAEDTRVLQNVGNHAQFNILSLSIRPEFSSPNSCDCVLPSASCFKELLHSWQSVAPVLGRSHTAFTQI